MSYRILKGLILSAIWAAAACAVAADDLDAALEARKKKVTRRVYSERAQLDDRKLVVPKTPTEEEQTLDRELKQLEKQLNSQPVMARAPVVQRPIIPAPVQTENWLTPALLDPENTQAPSIEKTESNWIREELERQQALQKQQEDLEKEEALVNKMLREGSRESFSAGDSQLRQYDNTLRNTLTPHVFQSASQNVFADPLESFRQKDKKESSERKALFSPAVRANSGVIRSSFSPAPSKPRPSLPQPLSWQPQRGSPGSAKTLPSKLDWSGKKPKPLSPVERVRRASPIYRKDPFADDFIPGIKTSIWDE